MSRKNWEPLRSVSKGMPGQQEQTRPFLGENLGPANPIVALSIAILEATLVGLFFMHLKYGSRLTWIFVGASLFWLAILLLLILSDYGSRAAATI